MNEIATRSAMPISSIGDMKDFAEEIAKSGLLGPCTPAKAFVITQHCAANEMSVLDFKMKYHVTDRGDVQMRSDRMLAEFKARGGKCVWTDISPTRAAAKFTMGENIDLEVEYTLEEAKKAGHVRPKSAWESDPGAMCRARVITRGVRIVDPGAIAGAYEPSELPDEPTAHTPLTDAERAERAKRLVAEEVKAEEVKGKDEKSKPAAKSAAKSTKKKADPTPDDTEAVDAELVESSPFDVFETCPQPGGLKGKKWADLPDEVLTAALDLESVEKGGSMEKGHYDAVKAEMKKRGVK